MSQWGSAETAKFWRTLTANRAAHAQWKRQAERAYAHSCRSEPMPGIWPKYTARVEIAMALHAGIERGGRAFPNSLIREMKEVSLDRIDFYGVAEALLSDALVERLDNKKARHNRA
jgi:hypothetical protein